MRGTHKRFLTVNKVEASVNGDADPASKPFKVDFHTKIKSIELATMLKNCSSQQRSEKRMTKARWVRYEEGLRENLT